MSLTTGRRRAYVVQSPSSEFMRAAARFAFLFVSLAFSSVVRGQVTSAADTISPKAVADSQAALRALDDRVRSNPKDADAWYKRGMVAWSLFMRGKAKDAPRELDPTRLGRLADTSLRIAIQLAPDNANYRRVFGRFLLQTGPAITRSAAGNFFEAAQDVARKNNDTLALVEADIEVGRTHWRTYDALVNRRIETTPGATVRSITEAMNPTAKAQTAQAENSAADPMGARTDVDAPAQSMKAVRQALELGTMPLPPDVSGEHEYDEAVRLFREAYAMAPNVPRAFRSLAMTMAERNQWTDLEALSRKQISRIPWDGTAWMALGLSLHRQGKSNVAAAAFDSAMSYVTPSDRARLDQMNRVRPAGDTTRLARGTEAERTAISRLYWLFADPMWSRAGNESRVEYFARVTYAELRWTVDELNVRGVDTDRGNIYVRYGPPEMISVLGPSPRDGSAEITTIWIYKTGLMFAFKGMATYATARTPGDDMAMVATITSAVPVRWDNLATEIVDSIPAEIARFRGGRDSVDIVVAADPPSSVSTAGRANVWLITPGAVIVYKDSSALQSPAVRTWSKRVQPGVYIFRAEASTSGDTSRAARTTNIVDATLAPASGLTAKGEGLSDILLGTNAEMRGSGRRWSDVDITSIVSSIPKNSPLAIVWENYELGQKDGTAQYDVAITLSRERSTVGKIAAKVTGALATAARIEQRGDNVTISFDRNVPYAAAFADAITVSLQDTPPGKYQVTVSVTDRVTKQVLTRSRAFTIRG